MRPVSEIYIRMTSQEYEAFDVRTQRISQIYAILNLPENKRVFSQF